MVVTMYVVNGSDDVLAISFLYFIVYLYDIIPVKRSIADFQQQQVLDKRSTLTLSPSLSFWLLLCFPPLSLSHPYLFIPIYYSSFSLVNLFIYLLTSRQGLSIYLSIIYIPACILICVISSSLYIDADMYTFLCACMCVCQCIYGCK